MHDHSRRVTARGVSDGARGGRECSAEGAADAAYRTKRARRSAPSRWAASRSRSLLHCLYTRHHNGFVRQRHLGFLLASNEVWTAPFVVQLVGEYVLPIVVQIERELGALHEAHFSAFLMENEAFLRLTSARVRSYWNAYFRSHDVPRSAHPGEVVLRRFEEWVKPRQAPCCETMHAPRGSTQGV